MKNKLFLSICLCFMIVFSINFAEDYIQGKVLTLEKSHKLDKTDENIIGTDEFRIKILEGKEKGKEIIIFQPIYSESAYNMDVKVGDKIVIYKDNDDYFIADIDRRGNLINLFLLFSIMIIAIARWKGLKALISLIISITIVYKIFLPLIVKGYSPILISTIVALLASAITILLSTGISKKGVVAILGAVAGVVGAGIISMYFSYKMSMTGFTTIDSLNFSEMLRGIKVKEIISAGVILGSMGAVMDISMYSFCFK